MRWCGVLFALAGCGRLDFDLLSAPTVVQTTSINVTGQVTAMLPLTPTKRGDLLVVATGDFSPAQPIVTMSDDAGNIYVPASAPATSSVDMVEMWYAADSKPGATVLTVSGASPSERQLWFLELSGMDLTEPLDVALATSNASSAVPAAPLVTPSTSPSVIVSVANVISNIVSLDPSSPFVAMPILIGNNTAYYLASAPGAYGAVWDANGLGGYCAITAAFKSGP